MKGLVLSAAYHPSFSPLLEAAPVEAMPLLGRPILAWHLEQFAAMGISEVMLVLHHLPHVTIALLKEWAPRGMNVRTCMVRSTGGLRERLQACASFLTETTLLIQGDRLPLLDFAPAIRSHQASRPLLTSIVSAERPKDLDGICLIEPELLRALAGAPAEGEWLEFLRERSFPLATMAVAGAAYLMDSPQEFAKTSKALLGGGMAIDPRAFVHPSAQVHSPVYIGPDCRVEQDARVGPGVILNRGVHVRRGASLEACTVLDDVRLGLGRSFKDRLLAPHGSFHLGSALSAFEPSLDPEELRSTHGAHSGEQWAQLGDSLLAWIALVSLSPLLLLISLLIYLDDPGPIFYTQLRVGQDRRSCRLGGLRGRIFSLYKFRTMRVGADSEVEALRQHNHYGQGAFFKLERDPRLTRLGAWLRRSSLDELPQLLNVAAGDMRLVGNRPLPLYEAEALSEGWQRIRFASPAGITGLWQISGRSDLSERERMVLDSTYAVTRTYWSDLFILAKTIPALLLRRGAR